MGEAEVAVAVSAQLAFPLTGNRSLIGAPPGPSSPQKDGEPNSASFSPRLPTIVCLRVVHKLKLSHISYSSLATLGFERTQLASRILEEELDRSRRASENRRRYSDGY
jgi:hypothetical protein